MPIKRLSDMSSFKLLNCRLCRQLTLIVILSILAIEAFILVPSWHLLRGNLYGRLEDQSRQVLIFTLRGLDHHKLDHLVETNAEALVQSRIRGMTIYDRKGEPLISFGEAPGLIPDEGVVEGLGPIRDGESQAHEIVWPAAGEKLPLIVAARLDDSHIGAELQSFVLRVGGLVLIIAGFVSISMAIAYRILVINPLLAIRLNLQAAHEDPGHPEQYKLSIGRNDELGDTVASLNALLDRLSEAHRTELARREQRFKDFADASSDWFWEMDEKLRFSYFSDRFTDTTGVSPEALLGKTREETGIPNVDEEEWHRHLENLAARRAFRDFQHPRVLPDGQVVHLSISGKPAFDADGNFKGFRGVGRDVTHRVESQQALEESRAALAEAQAQAKIGNWRWSIEEDRLLSCSEEFARIHGVGLDEIYDLLAHQIERVIHPDDRQQVVESFARFDEEGCDYEIEYRIIRADGEVRHVIEIGSVVRDAEGRPVEQTGTVQDITERKLAEEAVRQARDELEERVVERTRELEQRREALLVAKEQAEIANRAKSEFLANMSHELRTPLSAIIGFAEILKDERLKPKDQAQVDDYLNDIHVSGQHLLSLINDILDLSKIEAGNAQLQDDEIDLSDLVATCLRLVAPRADEGGLELRFAPPQESLPPLRADYRMIKQILTNLLSNAVKFTPEGGWIEVGFWLRPSGGYVLRVADSGIGMAPDDIPRALARFEQLDSQHSRRYDGAGLGLPMVKSLVELHGGSLELTSEPGVGTTVTVSFSEERTLTPTLSSSVPKASRQAAG